MGVDEKAFWEMFWQKRDAKDPVLQWEIGIINRWGKCGAEMNPDEAFKWFNLSAKQGNKGAQYDLATCYRDGYGIKKDVVQAKAWFTKAVDQSYAPAQNSLAILYEEEGNYQESRRLFELSAGQDFWRACENVGINCQEGNFGFEKDFGMAKMYYEKALANKDYPGQRAGQADIDRITASLAEVNQEIATEEEKLLAARQAQRDRVFVSYAHKDAEFLDELAPHLESLKKRAEIDYWTDRDIQPGEKGDAKIRENMAKAKVAVLLISANFLSSEYIWSTELPILLEAAEQEGATILCVLTRTCDYDDTAIKERAYQFVKPSGAALVPLAKMSGGERDDIYTILAKRVKELFKND